jgi:pimeloyl-ACP methyl ester carboxylesterase
MRPAVLVTIMMASSVVAFGVADTQLPESPRAIHLAPCRVASVPVELRCATYDVYEDRDHRRGRRVPLFIRVIPAATDTPAPDPLVFVSAGGPGITNSDIVGYAFARAWRRDRDVVLVDLRGTSGPQRLDCPTPGSADHPAAYLQPEFDSAVVAHCRSQLEMRANLRLYTTRNVVDDLHEVVTALGYRRINLWGASGGTREVLEYLRRHGGSVRSAIVEGTAPVSFKNPLPHAAAGQEALDSMFVQCDRDESCRSTFPGLRREFKALEDTLSIRAARVLVPPELGGIDSTVEVSWAIFAETIREMSYTAASERSIPFVVHRAALGDFAPLIQTGVTASRRTRDAIRLGFLLSQSCTEDVPRITETEILRDTKGSYLGDRRVRAQQRACSAWPRGAVDPSDFTDVHSAVPVFLLAGTIDPVTRPSFALGAARSLRRSILVVAPGGHVPNGPCVDKMERQFLALGSPTGIDTTCVSEMTLPPFRLQ